MNAYSSPSCPKCGSFGSIVELGKCCTIARLRARAEEEPERYAAIYYPDAARRQNTGGRQDA